MRTRFLLLTLLGAGLLLPTSACAAFQHVVAPGETLTSVAAVDGLSVGALAVANRISPAAELTAGSELIIPPRGPLVSVSPAADEAPSSSSEVSEVSGPAAGYRVRRGDTLTSIAAHFGVGVARLAAANRMSVAGLLLAGRTLSIDGIASAAPSAASAPPAPSATLRPAGAPAEEMVAPADVGTAALRAGVAPSLAEAVADQESGFNNAEVSGTGARGVMQIEPGTESYLHDVLGVPDHGDGASANLADGVALLHALLGQTGGDESEAIAGYYQGLSSLRAHGMYADTRRYVADVLALQGRFGG